MRRFGGTPAGTAENQQLMSGKNRLGNNGSHTAGSNNLHQGGDGMDEEDDHIAHASSYQLPNYVNFNVFWISPGTGQ